VSGGGSHSTKRTSSGSFRRAAVWTNVSTAFAHFFKKNYFRLAENFTCVHGVFVRVHVRVREYVGVECVFVWFSLG
jgi:hypothetical protein